MQVTRVITNPDGSLTFVELTPEEIAADLERGKREQAERIAAKGHDCWEHPVHSLFRSHRGGMQDAYNCALCGDLLQVG